MTGLLKVGILAFSLGLDSLSVAAGIGMGGVTRRQLWHIGLLFALAQGLMPGVGIVLGQVLGHVLGEVAGYVGFGALMALGAVVIWEALRRPHRPLNLSSGWGLVLAALSISLDSVAVGFTLGLLETPVWVSLALIALSGFLFTFLGLAVGARIGRRVERWAQPVAGGVLLATGLGLLLQKLLLPGHV